jgi:phenylacetate-CoA ligase
MPANNSERRRLTRLDRAALAEHQLEKLNELLDQILPANHFYAEKLAGLKRPLQSLDELRKLPFTFKDELIDARRHDLAANLTWPLERYARFHRTSGTHGRPMAVLDTADDWRWWLDGWQFVLDAAEVSAADRVLMAFSFGPFIGFWSAYDAAAARGAMVIPTGGMSSLARLDLLRTSQATVLCCTPSYALHLLETAGDNNFDAAGLDVRAIIVAGEPGGSIRSVRRRIERGFRATLIDHAGATEVGPWGYADADRVGLHVNESLFIAEFLSLESGRPAAEGEVAELVLTTLGRAGAPVIRYRTHDLVRPRWKTGQDCSFVLLDGGILGRADDMLTIRGVNVFPSAVQQILHGFPEIVEYRLILKRVREMDELCVEIEDRLGEPRRVADELQLKLGLRVEVRLAPLGSLPRFDGKGNRVVDERDSSSS